MIRKVPNTLIAYRYSDEFGMEKTWDGGETWHFTFRGWREIEEMHPTIELGDLELPTNEENEREIFGETLDEPIPDDYWYMIEGV